jgi:hypothetical protein
MKRTTAPAAAATAPRPNTHRNPKEVRAVPQQVTTLTTPTPGTIDLLGASEDPNRALS